MKHSSSNRLLVAFVTLFFVCVLSWPGIVDCKSFGGGSRSSFSSGSRSSGGWGSRSSSSWGSKKSSGGWGSGSSWGSRSSTTSKPSWGSKSGTSSTARNWGSKSSATTTTPHVGTFNKPSTSGRAAIMGSQTKARTQAQSKPAPSTNKYTSGSYGGKTYYNAKPYKAPRPRQTVVVKKYYYNGRPSYMWYDRGHYYDPFSFSATWWLLHWAELEHQRELMQDARYAAMRAQVEALRTQGVVPDAGYTENIAPMPITEPVRPYRTHSFLYYLLWTLGVVVVLGVIVAIIRGGE